MRMLAMLVGMLSSMPAFAGDPVIWLGIDYTFVRMIGTGDFNEPNEIFPGYLEQWNALWLEEMVPEMRSTLRSEIVVDSAAVYALNRRTGSSQIERRDGSASILESTLITDAMLAAQVKGYALAATTGQALVIVADRLVKLQETGCGWIVWFDVSTRSIETKTRMCKEAGGFGFRNYWFHPFKELIPELRRSRPAH